MHIVSRARLTVIWMLLPLLALVAGAEEDYSGGILDRAAVLARAAEVTSAKYPDAEMVRVADLHKARYEPDGTFVQWQEAYVKILTEQGRRRYRTLSSYFTIPYQRGPEDCRIDLVELVKPDGSAVTIDVEKQSRIMINPGDMSKNIYNPNDKLIEVTLAGVEVGDVVHYVMFDRMVQPRMKDSWADVFLFEGTEPILSSAVEVSAPAERPLRGVALKAPLAGTVSYTNRIEQGRTLHRWEARDVPRMFPEPNMPPLYSCVQRLYLSTSPDWPTVSRWYWELSEPHLATTPAIVAKVVELTNGLATAELRMRPLFDFVAQQVRYMGITVEATAPGYEPHDVEDTFNERHGVCRDKAALLVAMLRVAGFEAFPTLIHSGPKKDEDVALPYFNHAIVAVRTGDGSYQLMDPTDETSAEYLPAYLGDKSYLVATPEGDGLRTSPVDPAANNLMRIETIGRLDAEGGLAARTRLTFDGINDNVYRQWFANNRPEDRRRFIEGLDSRRVARRHLARV
jgi:transglutaminase-like putative cysteine protease